MATWVTWVKARRFPPIIKKYQKTRQFFKAVIAEANGSAVWARWKPTLQKGTDAVLQVDAAAIPNVRPLTDTGHIK